MPRLWTVVSIFGVLGAVSVAGFAANCSSTQGCAACKDPEEKSAGLVCKFVQEDAYCTCNLFLFAGSYACSLDGECDYLGGGGGGTGGGGTGGETCYRLPGQWCPAECSSCETVFWY
jgi:hypothetical protein